jgi:hypothetical protein
VTAASLENTGRIYLNGSCANQALLDVTAGSAGFGAAGVLSGTVRLVGHGYRSFEAELHRVRGEMLLKREPANPRRRRGRAEDRDLRLAASRDA